MEAAPIDEATWRAALSALLDGEEPSVSVAAVRDHLAGCTDCSAWLDESASVNLVMRALPMAPPDLGERVVNAVDVHLCACRTGGVCLCRDCHCDPRCTCRLTD